MAHTNILLAAALHAFSPRLPLAAVEEGSDPQPTLPLEPAPAVRQDGCPRPNSGHCAPSTRVCRWEPGQGGKSSRSSLVGHRPQQVAGHAALSPREGASRLPGAS